MDFNKLDTTTKQELHEAFMEYANILGGKNFFLTMIEQIRAEKTPALLNTSGVFHTQKAKVTLSKSMYKETFSALFDAIRKEEQTGDMLDGLAPKEYKTTMNMMRTLKTATITVESKEEEGKQFSFSILDTSEQKKTKATFVFKAIFFYRLDEAKKVLNYNA